MRVVAGIIGAIYYWIKEGRKENFWKRVFLKEFDTREEANKEYYTGLIIIIGVSAVLFFSYLLYRWLINDLP